MRARVWEALKQAGLSFRKESRKRRFRWMMGAAVIWLATLLILGLSESHGRFDSFYGRGLESFQLPQAHELPLAPVFALAGTLQPAASFNSFQDNYRRDWFELLLAADERGAFATQIPIALENLRLFAKDGSLLCDSDLRMELPQFPVSVGVDADLDLSRQSTRYWIPTVKGYRLGVQWNRRQFPGCPYEQPASVIADVVRRTTVEEETVWLELTNSSHTLRAGKSSVTARPGALPGEWWIDVANVGLRTLHLLPDAYPTHQGWSTVRYPRLLPIHTKRARRERTPVAYSYQLRFSSEAPDRLPIRLVHSEEMHIADVRFATDLDQREDELLPPSGRIPLKHTEPYIALNLPMQKQLQEYHELFLPIAMSAVCELTVVESGIPLRWRAVERLVEETGRRYLGRNDEFQMHAPIFPYRHYAELPEDYLGRVRWELQGTDGEQRFFQNIEVESELSCPSQLAWQALPYQQNATPWLVELETLSGISFDVDQPAREFFGRFRFLDAQGQALMPVASAAYLTDPTLESFVFSGNRLKFHGEVMRVEHLRVIDATPRTQRWTYRFMPLEVY